MIYILLCFIIIIIIWFILACVNLLAYVLLISYLKWDLIKIQSIAHIIICADCFWVVVHHNGFVSHLWNEQFSNTLTFHKIMNLCFILNHSSFSLKMDGSPSSAP